MPAGLAILICSGGLDSVTAAYYLNDIGYDLNIISFDYGQRHVKELKCARCCAETLRVKYDVIDLTSLGPLLSGSALTDNNVEVPDGHYEEESMKATIVPNRNAIMLSIAFAIAQSRDAEYVAAAFHTGDHHIYPDCRAEFTDVFSTMQKVSQEGLCKIDLLTPFLSSSKTNVAYHAGRLGVPVSNTWSCYKGGHYHCGTCGTCTERIESLAEAGVYDGTYYESENIDVPNK